jgi:hypothetical protein
MLGLQLWLLLLDDLLVLLHSAMENPRLEMFR